MFRRLIPFGLGVMFLVACTGCHRVESAPAKALPAATWQRDLAAFDAELAQRRDAFAAEGHEGRTKEDAKRILAHLHDIDQYKSKAWNLPWEHGYGGTEDEAQFLAAFNPRSKRLDRDHVEALSRLLDRWGWFVRGEWGDEADDQAWLIAQHADDDLPFQKRVLALLEPLHESGGTDPKNYAYLWDRVAVNERRLQRYGTQGFCTGPGKWTPRPMEDPEGVDVRRRSVGLPPLAEYVAHMNGYCHKDETERATGKKD